MITAIKKNKFESIRPWQRSHFLEQNLLCLTKSSSLLNRRILQMLQLNGLGLSWMRLVWPSRRWILAKLLSQRLHLNGLSLRCTSFMCCSSPKSMKKRLWLSADTTPSVSTTSSPSSPPSWSTSTSPPSDTTSGKSLPKSFRLDVTFFQLFFLGYSGFSLLLSN